MRTYLVTGGMGFIGSNFILSARKNKWGNIVNLDKLTYASNAQTLQDLSNDGGYTFVQGDIRDRELVTTLFDRFSPDAVLNFAAESHVDRSILDPSEFIQTNVFGTFQMLEAAKAYWEKLDKDKKSLFRFLHVSTDEVYGSLNPNDEAFREDTPYAPNSPYAASKAASDHLVRAYQHTYSFPTLTTNCSNNYGPRQFPEKLIPLILLNALEEKSLPIYGDGQNIRDWLYVEDHCNAIYEVLKRSQVGETYNIGGCNELTNLSVVENICSILDEVLPKSNFKYSSLITFVKDRLGHDRRYAINCEKIYRDLGWKPEVDFESGLRKTINWYLESSDWINQIRSGEYRKWIERNYSRRN
ncbi:MAG: dTDP-glucose 4,6-dehydratase [Elainellaceae cyanobacterium]